MNIRDASSLYLKNYSPNHTTYSTYVSMTQDFCSFFGGGQHYDKIDCKQVVDYANYRQNHALVLPSTIKRNLTTLNTILKNASIYEKNHSFHSPVTDAIKTPYLKNLLKRRKPNPKRVEKNNITLLKTGITEHSRPILPCMLLALELGLRAGEILRIERQHVDLVHNTLYIPKSKTGYSATIPISKRAYYVLKKWNYDFYTSRPKTWVSSTFRRVKKRAAKDHPHLNLIRFHDFRHECIYRLFQNGLNILEVAEISRHRNCLSLLNYLAVSQSDLAAKMW